MAALGDVALEGVADGVTVLSFRFARGTCELVPGALGEKCAAAAAAGLDGGALLGGADAPRWLRLAATVVPLVVAFALGWASRGGGRTVVARLAAASSALARLVAALPLLRLVAAAAVARAVWRTFTPYEGTLRRWLGLRAAEAPVDEGREGPVGGAVYVTDAHRAEFDARVAEWRAEVGGGGADRGRAGTGARAGGRGAAAAWELMCDQACDGLRYQAWRRWSDDRRTTMYMSRTVIEDASAAEVSAFYLDDAARMGWDGMLVRAEEVDHGDSATRSAVVRWERRYPVFCSNREYYIGQRVFDERAATGADAITTITAGRPHAHVPRRRSLFRVTNYLSAWTCTTLPGGACETLLLHHEDMGIQKSIARCAVKQCMWNFVKGMGPGARRYIDARRASMGASRSRVALDVPAFSVDGGSDGSALSVSSRCGSDAGSGTVAYAQEGADGDGAGLGGAHMGFVTEARGAPWKRRLRAVAAAALVAAVARRMR